MDPISIIAIIGLALSAVTAVGSGLASHFQQRKTNQFNQQQYEDWKEYNTPANQMARLQDAGLNPYLVSNVGNTLSEPFRIGQNTGVAESLQGLSNSLAQGAQFAQNHYENELNREIQKDNLKVRQQQLELNILGMNIREKLAKNALRIGDARTALLWSQGRAQDIQNIFNKSALPYRLDSLFYGNMLKQQAIDHNAVMNPLLEHYYEPVQKAKISSLYRQQSHYDFMESYLADKLAQEMAFKYDNMYGLRELAWSRYLQAQDMFNLRLGLSRDYLGFAKKKFAWSNLWHGLNTANSIFGNIKGFGSKSIPYFSNSTFSY